jgi:hypothetical protein
MVNTPDREHLMQFLEELEALLTQSFDRGWVPEALKESFKNSWGETIRQLETPLEDPAFDAALESAGLTGEPLRFKVALFRYTREEFKSPPPKRGLMRRAIERLGGKVPLGDRIKRLFKRALDTADVILDSFARAIPGAEGLREIKDGVRGVTSD